MAADAVATNSASACSMRAASGSSGSIGALMRPREARRRRTGAGSGADAIVESGVWAPAGSACCEGSMTLPTTTSAAPAVRPADWRTAGPRTALPTSARDGRSGVASDGAGSDCVTGVAAADSCAAGRSMAGLTVAARRRGAARGGSGAATCSPAASSPSSPSSSRDRCTRASRWLLVGDRRGRRRARAAINPMGPASAP